MQIPPSIFFCPGCTAAVVWPTAATGLGNFHKNFPSNLSTELLTHSVQIFQILRETANPFSPPSANQLYCTVIYNDEVHTFDDVITTIIRAADCSREDAIGFATLIDREGRCVVRCAGFQVILVVVQSFPSHHAERFRHVLF